MLLAKILLYLTGTATFSLKRFTRIRSLLILRLSGSVAITISGEVCAPAVFPRSTLREINLLTRSLKRGQVLCLTLSVTLLTIGHTLNLTMLIDLITGSCTAYVKADQLVIETLQGSCGVQQQISGTDTATMNANIYNGILAQKQAKAGMIAQGASALLPSNWVNPVGYAAKGEQAEASYKQATYAIEHIETPVHSQGAASPLLGWVQEFNARLIIYYPEGDVITNAIPPSFKPAPLAAFGHLKGFATATPGTVGLFRSSNTAFLSGDIIAEDIPCTLSERNRIKSMFADGVYLPPL